MPSYRFCRTDDVPLLVEAFERCFRVHFPDLPPLTVEAFKLAMRERGRWASSCMVAFDGREPIAVLLASKREDATLVEAIGVRPDRLREGHGRHLVDSLRAKLAILGPRSLLAEVSSSASAGPAFLEACGWSREADWVDAEVLAASADLAQGASLVTQVGVEDLLAAGVLAGTRRPWDRSPDALRRRRERLRALAVVSEARVEAWLIDEDAPAGARRLAGCGVADPATGVAWLRLLLAHTGTGGRRLVLERAGREELALLEAAASSVLRGRATRAYSAAAAPA